MSLENKLLDQLVQNSSLVRVFAVLQSLLPAICQQYEQSKTYTSLPLKFFKDRARLKQKYFDENSKLLLLIYKYLTYLSKFLGLLLEWVEGVGRGCWGFYSRFSIN